jgi:hypothetical protein
MKTAKTLYQTTRRTALLASVALALTLPLPAAPALRAFRSKTYHFSVEYPAAWYDNTTKLPGTFNIINFPLSKAVHAVFLPSKGAEISLIPLEAMHPRIPPKTLGEWIKADKRGGTVTSERSFRMKAPDGDLSVVELIQRWDEGSATVAWYFSLFGRAFRCQVASWTKDGDRPDLVSTMEGIVATLRLTSD